MAPNFKSPLQSSSFAGVITVEPAFFLYYIVINIIETTNTNLYLQKECRFNQTTEPNLDSPCNDEKLGVRFASEMNSSYHFITLTFCAVYAMVAASWSDAAGKRRRPLIFMPIIGVILQAIQGCVHSYFWYWNPFFAMLSNNLAEMVTGGMSFMIFGTQMYICDVSSMESRTMRMGILMTVGMLAQIAGSGGSGYLLRKVGFFYTYLACSALSFTSLIMAAAFIKDKSVPVPRKSVRGAIFNMVEIVNAYKTVFKKSLGEKRLIVLILLIIYTTVSFSTNGEKSVLYLYLRYRFHWEEREYSIYVVYRSLGVIIGSVFCSVVLSKLLKVHDGVIGILAGAFDTIAVLGYIFAYKNWHLYAVPLFDIFHGAVISVSFSFLSKFYDNTELGRLSAVLGVCMLIFPLCFPVYNGIFQATLDKFPSAFFLLSVFLDTITVVLFCIAYLWSRNLERRRRVEVSQPTIGEGECPMTSLN